MAKVIKKLKMKKPDETMSDYIPIGAEAENVNVDGESVEIKLNKTPYYYNNVADMKADEKLKAGDMTVTLGYYEANDGGAGEYRIINNKSQNEYQEELNNSLYATLIAKDIVNVKQCGAYGDGEHDDTDSIQNSINKFDKIFIPNGIYVISDTIILPKNHKIQGENIDNTIIHGTCSGEYIFQYMTSYDYQSFNSMIDTLTITKPQTLQDPPKGINFTNGSIKLTNLKLINICNPINAGSRYKDNIYIENITVTYSTGYSTMDYFFDINCNCDNLYLNQIRTGFNKNTWSDDIQHTMRIRNSTGGIINNMTLGNHLVIDRCNNLQLNAIHFESDGINNKQIKISNSFVTINNLLKWKNPTASDIVITSDSRGNNCHVTLNNIEFSFYPSASTENIPSDDFVEIDTWSTLITHNVKYRLQQQKINNLYTNVLFQPPQLNPYNDSIILPDVYNIKTYGANAALGAYYPTAINVNWNGGDYKKYMFFIVDNPNSNKYVNKTNAITIESSCYFHLRNGDYKAKNCYCIIYGSNDNGSTYTRKWKISLDSLGIIMTNGATFNMASYETSENYASEISNYILCTKINYENTNYKIYCNALTNTTYAIGDEIISPETKYIYTSTGLKEFTLI